ncbi:HAMP domain-containing histidine kinase [Kineosporiaceae bacterium SCSIO 59966]|nr:HAMP domain-containing histidine kinase [Kineosporiaceae bacterium SCSIO 59966]
MTATGRAGGRTGLGTRLLAAQVLVVLTGAATAWLVAGVVGPPIFHEHLARAAGTEPGQELAHAEAAFQSATVIALAVALLAATAAALAVSLLVTRRVRRSLRTLSEAASTVAAGRYTARVHAAGLGAEFDALALSFNRMADRLQSVEATRRRLLADLAHEMRTPVATLDAYLEAFEDGVRDLDADTAAMLRTQTRRLGRLAQDVSAVSRVEEHQVPLAVRRVPAEALVHSAMAAAATRFADRGVALTAQVSAGVPNLEVDPDRLGQVLGNLLDNALRHTPGGGRVTVSAHRRDGGAEIEVTDTGEGIAPEHLDHVLERFYRVDSARDREHGGSGVGLAICKALVEEHGGRITVLSAGPGAGTTVRVWLPVPGHRPAPTASG